MKKPDPLQARAHGDREIVITRTFNAPRELVFDAWTTPELLARWFGPPDWKLTGCEVDARPGGGYRFVMQHDNGATMGITGRFREVERPHRLVSTEIYDEDWTGGETLITNELEEDGGRTIMTITILYSSPETRDMVLTSPMEQGMELGFSRLDDVLATTKTTA
jgi:uncharacterized protein YndB with AHSA1/START domain